MDGSEWKLLRIDGDSPAMPEQAHFAFHKGRIETSVGCNGMGGPYRIEGTQLIAGPLVQTEIYCEGPVWKQEKALGALLVSAPQISFDETRMTLVSSGHRVEMERLNPPQ